MSATVPAPRLALIVDDDPDVAMACALHLEGAGYQVVEASSGAEAFDLACSSSPAVVVLDWTLPDLDGLQVLARLRDDDRTAAVPVVMLTARARDRDQVAARDAGVTDYLVKPFEGAALVSAVNAAADHRIPRARDPRDRSVAPVPTPDSGDRVRQTQLAAIFESAPDAIVVVDEDDRIDLVNERTEALFGRSRVAMLGEPIEMLVPHRLRSRFRERCRSHARRRGERGPGAGLDLIGLRADGSEFAIEISLRALPSGTGATYAATIRDVSEHKAAEARLRQLLEAAPDPVVGVDRHGRIVLVNKQTEHVFGYARDDLLDGPVERLLPELMDALTPEQRHGIFDDPGPEGVHGSVDLAARCEGGSEFLAEISFASLEVGEVRMLAASVRDITARRRAEEVQSLAYEREREATARLREVDRLRSDFLSTVSHELRTPLTAIKGFAEWLDGNWDTASEDRKRHLVNRIVNAGGRLELLIHDLLDFSRLERGHLAVDLAPHSLSQVVQEALRELGPALEQHTLKVDVDEETIVLVDAAATARVLENLLTNAAKFSSPGSVIALSSEPDVDPATVVLSVRDEGVGILPEEQGKVFDRFYRISETSTRPGTGIGLAIVKQFVEAQGGSVELWSQPGEGSDFRLRLPRAPHPLTPDET